MKANTIKIEDPLLKDVYKIKPKTVNFSAFVREILEKEVRKREMIAAAENYNQWLEGQGDEKDWMKDWEAADLGSSVSGKSKKEDL